MALGSRLVWWWPASDRRRGHGFVLADYPRLRLNDGRADPLGNFWVGSMRNNLGPDGELLPAGGNEGVLYRIAPDGSVTVHATGIGLSNTFCWSPDDSFFYTADTLANMVWRYNFIGTPRRLAGERTFSAGCQRGCRTARRWMPRRICGIAASAPARWYVWHRTVESSAGCACHSGM